MITVLILLAALGVLGWGFYRAQPFGKLGILAWLQSVVLMAPWLAFFGLFTAGIYLNLAGMLLLFVFSIGLYIFLGKRLRAAGGDPSVLKRVSATTDASRFSDKTDAPDPSQINSPDPQKQESAQVASDHAETLPIPPDDLKLIQGIFGIDTFFATDTIPYRDGAIFKGNLRGTIDGSYDRLSASLAERVGDRYRLFLITGPDNKPVIVILPSTDDPKPTTPAQWVLAIALMLGTIAATLEASGMLIGFDLFSEPQRWQETLPFSLGVLLVLVVHELGHILLARRHQVRLSPPFFIPTWQVGSFGAITRFQSLLPNRTVLFDIALAGPACGGLVSMALLIIGLLLSHPGSLFQLQPEFFQGSILVGTMARVVLGEALKQPLVDIHPLVVTGWLGLVLTAINLMPAGQLDGGRIVQSIYGRKTTGRATVVTLIFLGLAALVNPLALYWAILILFLQRDLERPALNELSEPNDARAALGLLALFLMAATLLPLTPNLAGRLGIGG